MAIDDKLFEVVSDEEMTYLDAVMAKADAAQSAMKPFSHLRCWRTSSACRTT